jgi:hypothetical protein
MGILLADLAAAYEARSAGMPSPLSPLRLQFADYVCWLARWLHTDDAQRQHAYWQQKLAEPVAHLPLSAKGHHAGRDGRRFRRIRRRVAGEVMAALSESARAHGVSVFTAVLAAFKLFLYRRTGVTDIAVATMVSTRDGSDLQRVIGPLLTTQILRTRLDGECRVSDLFARVQRTDRGRGAVESRRPDRSGAVGSHGTGLAIGRVRGADADAVPADR